MRKKEKKFVEFMKQILENNILEDILIMRYIEMTVEEAMKYCNKTDKVLVAIQNLEKKDTDVIFIQKRRNDYRDIFRDAKTISSMCDNLIKELNVFTEKQDLANIQPKGLHKIVLLHEQLE